MFLYAWIMWALDICHRFYNSSLIKNRFIEENNVFGTYFPRNIQYVIHSGRMDISMHNWWNIWRGKEKARKKEGKGRSRNHNHRRSLSSIQQINLDEFCRCQWLFCVLWGPFVANKENLIVAELGWKDCIQLSGFNAWRMWSAIWILMPNVTFTEGMNGGHRLSSVLWQHASCMKCHHPFPCPDSSHSTDLLL